MSGWWTALRPTFEKECDSFHLLLGSEFTFGETTVHPLYSDNGYLGYSLNDARSDQLLRDYVSTIDLNYILEKLMKDTLVACDREGNL